jgi:hypothetical protein
MGFFGGSTTYVASTLYSMAGEPLERANYLKTTVIGAALIPSQGSMSEAIPRSYLHGPGLRARSFFRWAEENYDGIGVPKGNLGGSGAIDPQLVKDSIPHDSQTETVDLIKVKTGIADIAFWAEQWLYENNPSAAETAYTVDIDPSGLATITYEDATTQTFTPANFDNEGIYVYAAYTLTSGDPPVTSGKKIWIYKMGDGNTDLDAALAATADDGEYLPFIPVRLDNKFLSPTYEPDSYALAKKAWKKAGFGKMDDMITDLKDNEDLDEIDYAYLMFGVPLNIFDTAGRQYLYRFFQKLRTQQTSGNAEWLLYQQKVQNGEQATAPENYVHIKSNGSFDTNVNMSVTWNSIKEVTGTGPAMIGKVEGDYWVETITVQGSDNAIRIVHQETDNSWRAVEVIGAVHHNLIYNNKAVIITAVEALEETDESGFLIPLHYATFREMSMVDSTQLATQTAFMVFNSYKVVKKKWYQTGIFKLVVFVAIIAITVLTAGSGTAPSVGLLGSAAAVGAAIGLTGTLALIVGAIANALVSMILMKIIAEGSILLFGEKWGALIGTIVSLVTLQVGTGLMNGMSMGQVWTQMSSAVNIINMTSAVGGGVAQFIMAGAMETMAKTEQMLKEADKKSHELSMKFAEEFGYAKAELDPLGLTDASIGNAMESEVQFLSRTLMTGTDIAEMTKDMLNNMAEYTLSLERQV